MAIDILHTGHINIIDTARKLGDLTIGLLTDAAIVSYKRLPLIDFEKRKLIAENIKGVKAVIVQDTFDYEPILRNLKPDYLVHGDDWKTGIQKKIRKKVIKTLKKWSGKLIEPKYTKNISSSKIKNKIVKIGTSPENRISKLKRLIDAKKIVRIIESHNALTGLIVEN